MKSWALAAILVSLGALAACGESETGGSGGAGAGDGSGGKGASGSTSDSSTSTSSTTSSSSSGLPPICDDTETECGGDSRSGCWKCASIGPCKAFLDACIMGNDACYALLSCLEPCASDATCIEDCRTQHSEGTASYDAIINCITCDQCPTACNAAEEPLCQAP